MKPSGSSRRKRKGPGNRPNGAARTDRSAATDTLQKALRKLHPQLSWNQARSMVSGRRVTVDGNLCIDVNRRIRPGETIKLLAEARAPLPTADDVELVYLDEHVVVVNKPPGITSVRHPHERGQPRRQFQKTLDELLPEVIARLERSKVRNRSRRRETAGRRSSPQRVISVHRLDRETSGLMVFARTRTAADRLIEQFRVHSTRRAYQAIVFGGVRAQRIESNLVRDRGDGRRGSVSTENVGKRAVTHVRPIRKLGPLTWIECQLETGRTHQIRIHLSELGHPLCGDSRYPGPVEARQILNAMRIPRMALHATHLTFLHPISGRALKFDSPLPRDLRKFIERVSTTKPREP